VKPTGADLITLPLLVAAAIALGVAYFHRIRTERPPVGVYTLTDIAIMTVAVIAMPIAYLHLPAAVVATVLGLMTVVVLQFALAPVLTGRFPPRLPLLLSIGAAAIDVALNAATPGSALRVAAPLWNNLLLLVLIIGIGNLYAQSGMKARDVAIFTAILAGYDLVATLLLPTMSDLLRKVAELPFAPVFATGPGPHPVTIGLGLISGAFPVMLIAGPVVTAEYLLLRHRHGPERTTAAYYQTRPMRADVTSLGRELE
jgi:hypothetical protein